VRRVCPVTFAAYPEGGRGKYLIGTTMVWRIVFVCSAANGNITGETVRVTGGL
jgi:hypothetical protein